MEDRSNIIKEAIEYRDKLEKKVEELAQSVVRLQISLDFADNTIKKKDRENAELKAYMDVNEDFKTAWEELKAEIDTLKSQLDFEVQKKEVLEAENERLKKLECKFKEYCTCNTEKYIQTLQEIKEIVEAMYEDYSKRWDDNISEGLEQIIDLITKAEEE